MTRGRGAGGSSAACMRTRGGTAGVSTTPVMPGGSPAAISTSTGRRGLDGGCGAGGGGEARRGLCWAAIGGQPGALPGPGING
jgi:hypothetical protein